MSANGGAGRTDCGVPDRVERLVLALKETSKLNEALRKYRESRTDPSTGER